MDVRCLHLALQFQIQTEMDVLLAFVIAALYSRRRVGCARGIPSRLFHSCVSAWDGRYGFMPSSEQECTGADCLVYFTPNLFLGTKTISFLIKCLFHTKTMSMLSIRKLCANWRRLQQWFGMMIAIAWIRKAFWRCPVSGDGFPNYANDYRWFAEDPEAVSN